MPEDRDSMTPALSNLRSALTITDRVMPTRSAILLATRMPSFPSSSSNMWIIASSSEKDNAVSYTHLDVYKRQVLFRALNYLIAAEGTASRAWGHVPPERFFRHLAYLPVTAVHPDFGEPAPFHHLRPEPPVERYIVNPPHPPSCRISGGCAGPVPPCANQSHT